MITDRTIKALLPGQARAEKAQKGAGRLVVRRTKAGSVFFYFRYSTAKGTRDSFPLGSYDPKGINGITLIQARDRTSDLSRMHRSKNGAIRSEIKPTAGDSSAINEDHANQRTSAVEAQASASVSSEMSVDSFRALLGTYVRSLESRGAESASQVKSNFKRHLLIPFPELCDRRAASLTPSDLLPPLERLINRGKGPSALTLRTQMYSAFECAAKAENDPRIADRKATFCIQQNPVSKIPALSEYKNAGDRALSERELAHYVCELKLLPPSAGKDALLVCLALGGQRMRQLLRVTSDSLDLEGQQFTDKAGKCLQIRTILLKDGKGRRKKPRLHVLPIVGLALPILIRLESSNKGKASLFINKVGSPLKASGASSLVSTISKKLLAENKIRNPFRFADIRRTCETLFANYDIHKDIRAQIQSHGLSGVQSTHYDRYDYVLQKHEALELWNSKLETLVETHVTPVRANAVEA